MDGGKVRLRGAKGEGSKRAGCSLAVRLQSLYYAAFFQDNLSLIDYVNSQPLSNPLVCLGDGHDDIWNLVAELGPKEQRWEILDWYHLRVQGTYLNLSGRVLKSLATYRYPPLDGLTNLSRFSVGV